MTKLSIIPYIFSKINRNNILTVLLIVILLIPMPAFPQENPRETPVVRAVRKVSPAVVNISTEVEVKHRSNPFSGFGFDPFFDSFFRDFFDAPSFERRYKRNSLGSGVIIDGERGYILTNEHVISKSGKITVILNDERTFEAQIVGADPDSDLAVLRIESDSPLPSIQMGHSDDILIGETVIAIGNPFGFSHTVTTGVVSAVNRTIHFENRTYRDFIQIDASINPGNSGGPLLNINGELIGINTAIYAKAQGIGFATPIDKARRIVNDLIKHGEVIPGWIGLSVQNLDSRLTGYFSLPGDYGVMVQSVSSGSPAWTSGIRRGDIVLSVGKEKIFSVDDYYSVMRDFSPGQPVEISIWRDRRTIVVNLVASVFPMDRARELAWNLLGVEVEDLSNRHKYGHGITAESGVIISVLDPGSYFSQVGVKPGDVIRQIDDLKIENLEDFEKAVVKYRRKTSLVVLVQRGDQGYYITLRLNTR